jgi:hypothetical protein
MKSRRRVFADALRYGVLGVLGVGSGLSLIKRHRLVREGRCVNEGICRKCGVFETCGLPRALVVREMSARGVYDSAKK